MKGYFDTAPPPTHTKELRMTGINSDVKFWIYFPLKRNHSRETNSSNNSRKRWATIKSCVDKCWERDKTHKAPKHAATAEVFSKLLLMSLVAVYFSLNVEGKPTPNTCTHKLLKTSSLVSKPQTPIVHLVSEQAVVCGHPHLPLWRLSLNCPCVLAQSPRPWLLRQCEIKEL